MNFFLYKCFSYFDTTAAQPSAPPSLNTETQNDNDDIYNAFVGAIENPTPTEAAEEKELLDAVKVRQQEEMRINHLLGKKGWVVVSLEGEELTTYAQKVNSKVKIKVNSKTDTPNTEENTT